MLDMYCKTCDEIICHECINTEHRDHHISSLYPFVKPCEERLDTLLKMIDKLLKCVDLARQTSQQQVDKAQHHIVSLKAQVTSMFTQIREKLAQQEESLMSELDEAATRVEKVASSTEDEQQLAEVNLESLRFLGDSLSKEGDVYDQMSNLPSLEEAVEKRWRTEIPGVVWMEQSDQDEKINLSDVDHLTLTETSHTTLALPRLEGDTRSDMVQRREGGAASVTGAVCNKPDQQKSESGEITRFNVGGEVYGICLYSNTIFLVKRDVAVYMYSSSSDLKKEHIVSGMNYSNDVMVMTQDGSDKLIITSLYPHSIYYISVQSTGDTCILGTTHRKKISYFPWGLCVNHNNNMVVGDHNNTSLHVYNSLGESTRSSCHLVVDRVTCHQIPLVATLLLTPQGRSSWIDGQGAEQRRHKDTACGITLFGLRGVVRDSENRYLVADRGNNQLLLFSKDEGDVRCLVKDKITQPYSLYLDQQQDKLYVGTGSRQVVVYDYYVLVEEKQPIKYNMTRLGIKST